jgi:hypothetical protein
MGGPVDYLRYETPRNDVLWESDGNTADPNELNEEPFPADVASRMMRRNSNQLAQITHTCPRGPKWKYQNG